MFNITLNPAAWELKHSKNSCTVGVTRNTTYDKDWLDTLHVCTVHQQYQSTFFINPTVAHNYKITGMLKQLKFSQLLQHVSAHSGAIIRELFRD